MLSARWLAKRKPFWARLTELVDRSNRQGVGALSHHELQELGLLYRQTAGDLATVREEPTGQSLSLYLNQLLSRAHNLIYMGRRGGASNVLHFFTHTYPRVFRQTLSYTTFAFALFLAGVVLGFLATLSDPAFSRFFLGPHMAETIERRKMWTESIVGIKPLASSAIMTNNMSVSFASFAFGITAGLGTIYMMFYNGLLFGVILAACWQAGMLKAILSFVVPHGVIELPAIFIAAGAGFLIARGLLFPGLLTRRDSLSQAGGQAVQLVLGTIPMLIIAGIVEAFISPTSLPPQLKFLIGALLFALFSAYLGTMGRDSSPTARPAPHP